ncbi:MAG: hypothetical protein OEV64_14165 [Desulfobulbaceae bacterium]|nr:hypothetical protein [Desulfobulbaceae bacterium]
MGKRNKIQYCLKDHLKMISEEERAEYQERFKDFIELVSGCESDEQVLARCKAHDAEHGTVFLDEAIHYTIYCIACHRADCVC